jgi:hypothetical protein
LTKQKVSGIWLIGIDDTSGGSREPTDRIYLKKDVSDADFNSDLCDAYEEAAICIVEKDLKGFKRHNRTSRITPPPFSKDYDFITALWDGNLISNVVSIMKEKGYSEVDFVNDIREFDSYSIDMSYAIKQAEKRAGKSGGSKSSKRIKSKK